jgi:release factor glutamine methyltransferase
MTLSEYLEQASSRLAMILSLERREARIEVRALVAHALSVEHSWLIGHDRDELDSAQMEAIASVIARREMGEPVAYILGEKEFYGHRFRVTPDVLIPRPETELLVDAVLDRSADHGNKRLLDLGTGSGCIAISIALARPGWEVVGVDNSQAALAVARENGRRLGARVAWRSSNWFADLKGATFDFILSNPPYIAATDAHLALGDVRFEPRTALVAGEDGLDDLRELIVSANKHLTREGCLVLEHGHDQSEVCRMLMIQQCYRDIVMLKDLAGISRVVWACKSIT